MAQLSQEETRVTLTRALLFALVARDEVSAIHCQNVSRHVRRLAEAWGLKEEERRLYHQAALLHDVGKIGISDRLLKSTEKYTEADREEMKQHVRIGGLLLSTLGFPPRWSKGQHTITSVTTAGAIWPAWRGKRSLWWPG
jgi:HD-GYP domain-containing protein (c-di-GMP phosphodiesterase class II)